MIKIAICEDEVIFRLETTRMLEEYFKEKYITYKIDSYAMGEELLEKDHQQYDIIFLDIEIKGGANGMDIARLLRKAGNDNYIIFLTSHQESVYEAFEVNAFRYLLKPIQKANLYPIADIVLKKIAKRKNDKIVFQRGKDYIQLSTYEIVHIETEARKVKVHTLNEIYSIDDRLNDLEEKLSEKYFCRIHRSYLINLKHVTLHKENSITLTSGEVVYISRLKLPMFKKMFMDYLRSQEDA